MNFEKFVNSKFYDAFEFCYRILVLNLLNIFFMMLLVTFIPSLNASFEVVKNIKNREYKFFKNYFITFWKNLGNTIAYSVFFILVFGLIGVSIYYYYTKTENDLFTQFGFLFMLLMFAIVFQMFVYMPIIISEFYFFNNLQKIKFAFYFSLNNILWTLVYDVLFILMFLSVLFVPLLFFMGEMSIFVYIVHRTSYQKMYRIKKIYEKTIQEDHNEVGN